MKPTASDRKKWKRFVMGIGNDSLTAILWSGHYYQNGLNLQIEERWKSDIIKDELNERIKCGLYDYPPIKTTEDGSYCVEIDYDLSYRN